MCPQKTIFAPQLRLLYNSSLCISLGASPDLAIGLTILTSIIFLRTSFKKKCSVLAINLLKLGFNPPKIWANWHHYVLRFACPRYSISYIFQDLRPWYQFINVLFILNPLVWFSTKVLSLEDLWVSWGQCLLWTDLHVILRNSRQWGWMEPGCSAVSQGAFPQPFLFFHLQLASS